MIMITIKTLVGFDEDRDKVRNKALEDSFHPPHKKTQSCHFSDTHPEKTRQQFAIWPGTQETARSEIAPYPEIIAKRGVYEVGRALRARRSV